MEKPQKGILIVLSAPSGTGKGTVIDKLLKLSDRFVLSVSATTRKPRNGEQDGKNYFFIDNSKFIKMIENSQLLEYTEYCDNFYGTPRSNVINMLDAGKDVILEIEVEGKAQIKKRFPEAISIFILPPSVDELKGRIFRRGLDDKDVIKKRIISAEREIKSAEDYDYIVINDSIDECVKNIYKIIESERMRAHRVKFIIDGVLNNGKNSIDR